MSRRRSNRYFQSSLSARSGQRHEAGLPISLSVAMMPSRIRVGRHVFGRALRTLPQLRIARLVRRPFPCTQCPFPSVSLPLQRAQLVEEPARPSPAATLSDTTTTIVSSSAPARADAYRRADPGGAGLGRATPCSGRGARSGRRPRLGRHPLPLSRRGGGKIATRVIDWVLPSARLVPRRVAVRRNPIAGPDGCWRR